MSISKNNGVEKVRKKPRKHRKLRRLVENGSTDIAQKWRKNDRKILILFIFVILTISMVLPYYGFNAYGNFVYNFLNTYQKQYMQISHGHAEYCNRILDTRTLFINIQKHIINQDNVLQQLEIYLRNESRFISLAVVGAVGVGKSLFVRNLEKYFPWQENIQSYAWNAYVKNKESRMHILANIKEKLHQCGRNLVVIDNLQPNSAYVTDTLNKIITNDLVAANKYTIIIYVYILNTMSSDASYLKDYNLLQNLPQTKTINFKRFGYNELKDCIKREALLANITLSLQDFDEIVETVNVTNSGCKKVYAKVQSFKNTGH
ncbi:uncharacterized protein LOC119669436 [Teleopsis dalmanni]|uniref:uncharacterized protein LOC119669436 n=1 Tax=Teleopsis dalmanni TaxID=139649 RepID=UPI0018CD175F|nr:uncharacterized protein LOC119669436 [Teleopsis dalmanni]